MDLNLSFDLRVEPRVNTILMIFPCTDCVAAKLSPGRSVHVFAAYPAQPLRAGSGPVPYLYYLHQMRLLDIALTLLLLFPSPFRCLSGCVRTGGYVKTGSSGATIWRWASQ